MPPAIENEWCKLDQKLKEKEAKQEAREKKMEHSNLHRKPSTVVMQQRKCAKYKDIKPVQTSINKSVVEASLGLSTVQKHKRPRYQTWLKFPPECIPIKEYTAKSANAFLGHNSHFEKNERIKSAEYGNKVMA